MEVDIYSGTLGVMFDKNKLVYKLNEYLINAEGSLSYEIKEGKTKVVIITGKNEVEKDLPMWSHPLVFTNVKGEKAVAIDLRPYMTSTVHDIISVREKLQDKYNGTLQLYRLVFTKLLLDDDVTWLPYVRQELMEALATIISTTVSMVVFDKSYNDNISIITKLHFLSLLNEDEKDLDKLLLRLPRKDIGELTHGSMKDLNRLIHTLYDEGELMIPSTTIGSLTNNIIKITSNRVKGLTPDILAQSLSRGFFSLDTKYQAIGILEDLPTLVSVLTMVITEGINSRSTFRKIIEGNKRVIKPKVFTKVIIRTYQDEILDY